MAGVDFLDTAPLIGDRRNVLLVCDGGAVLFCWSQAGVYEITECWKADVSILYVQEAIMRAVCWMYSHTDCETILTRTPCATLVSRNPLLVRTSAALLQIVDDHSCKVLKPN